MLRDRCTGVGAAELNECMKDHDQYSSMPMGEELTKFICKKISAKKDAIQACLEAIMWEPVDKMKRYGK